jgi:hypothetical protein
MKIRNSFAIFALSLCSLPAQVPVDRMPPMRGTNLFSFSPLPEPEAWPGTPLDWCSTARQFTQWITNNQTGEVTTHTPEIIQVGGGLNYLDAAGIWRESKDLIELTPDGGAASLQGPNKVFFNPSLSPTPGEGLKIITRSNLVFATYPTGGMALN